MPSHEASFRKRRQQQAERGKRQRLLRIGFVTVVVTTALIIAASLLPDSAVVTLTHVHGLGFSPDGEQLIVPAHDGLRIYEDGEWLNPDVPERDYMGFTPVNEGFYSSGHPGAGDTFPNPLGLVKSTDMGKTLQELAFSGESDFHLMGVGYENHAIYVLNSAPNSELDTGFYYSLDDGETWQQAAGAGLDARPFALAVHPTSENVVAMATEAGLFLSDDFGNSFTEVVEAVSEGEREVPIFVAFHPADAAGPVTAVTFHPNGERLLFGTSELFAFDLSSEELMELTAPPMGADDPMSYIAVNPVDNDEVAVATFNRDIYLSDDGGENWVQIAEEGKGT